MNNRAELIELIGNDDHELGRYLSVARADAAKAAFDYEILDDTIQSARLGGAEFIARSVRI